MQNIHKTKLRDSEQFKTTFALYTQDTVQKNESTSHTRMKNMVKKYLDQMTKDQNFDARNYSRRQGDDSNKQRRQETRRLSSVVGRTEVLHRRVMQFQT